jgi:hypothetical protein
MACNCGVQRRSGRGRGVVVQVVVGVANYGVNPTRLAPQAAAVVCAVKQDVWCGGGGPSAPRGLRLAVSLVENFTGF